MRPIEIIRLTTLFSILLLFFGTVRSYAQKGPTHYYVATIGNDSNPGTESLPWKTLAKAASMATANVTVFIKQGNYRERLVPVNSGTPGAPITFTCYPGDSATITGVGMTSPTGWWGGLIWIQGLKHIKVSGLRVTNSVNTGIQVENSSYITIEKNLVDSTYSPGIKVHACNNVVVQGNEVVHGCLGLEEESVSVSATNFIEIRGNLVHDGMTEGIDVKVGSSNGIVTKNEVYNQGLDRSGIYVDAWDSHEVNIDIFDNISHNNGCGLSVGAENDGLIEGIRIHHNKAYNNSRGVWVAGMGIGQKHLFNNIAIYENDFHDNGFGIEIGGYTGTTFDSIKVYNNLISRNKNAGVRITRYDGPSGAYAMRNVSVINNTIYRNGTVGNGWDADNGGMNIFNVSPESLVIKNNILGSNAFCTIFVGPEVPTESITIDYNFFSGFRNVLFEKAGTNPVYGNPLFVDSLINNYHLQAISPCIDIGHPDQEYNDPLDPNKPGYALYPAQGTLRNDMGAYGGPYATSWEASTSVDEKNSDFSSLPEEFKLYQNYPNPFNSNTTISYRLPNITDVSLSIYNVQGQLVDILVNDENQLAGIHSIRWDGKNEKGTNMSAGFYLFVLKTKDYVKVNKMLMIN
jgi:parallel beta-helix repeat protein